MSLVSQYRHVKTGGVYRVLAVAKLQISTMPGSRIGLDALAYMEVTKALDMTEMVIYISEKDQSIWVRPASEFHDGRFEAIG